MCVCVCVIRDKVANRGAEAARVFGGGFVSTRLALQALDLEHGRELCQKEKHGPKYDK